MRSIPTPLLFARLDTLGIRVDEQSFALFADSVETPEELAACLWTEEENIEGHDQAYLLLFELWRRLLPDRLSLSIFCDELDQLIDLYDQGTLPDEGLLENALLLLEDILDDASDVEGDPQKVFANVALYCAHDLEQFIVDYIGDQIERRDGTSASELLDAFSEYILDKRVISLLRARIFSLTDIQESNILFERLLSELQEEPDLELLLEMIKHLVNHGDIRLFQISVKQSLPLLAREEEFQYLLSHIARYYRCLDREEEEKRIASWLQEREGIPADRPVDPSDHTLKKLHSEEF
ncbi:MAG: hypothetical protein JSS61_04675 [Verrucomicrobia bacterium]|nr:hypothetical protein [Verrucomicrobiota bacterium]